MEKIVVASGSFFLIEAFDELDIPYEVHFTDITSQNEKLPEDISIDELVKTIAYKKALDISKKNSNRFFMSSQTEVILYGNKLEAPETNREIMETMQGLTGKYCTLFTGFCVLDNTSGKVTLKTHQNLVRIKYMSDEEIKNKVGDDTYFDHENKLKSFWLKNSFLDPEFEESKDDANSFRTTINEVFKSLQIHSSDYEEKDLSKDQNYLQSDEAKYQELVKKISSLEDHKQEESQYQDDVNKKYSEKHSVSEEEKESKSQPNHKKTEIENSHNTVKKDTFNKREEKKRKKSYHGVSYGEEVLSTIVDFFEGIFEQDILVKLIIALIAGIIAFGIIFSSMGFISGY